MRFCHQSQNDQLKKNISFQLVLSHTKYLLYLNTLF